MMSPLSKAFMLAGLCLFLISMPLDVLNGHGPGFLADPDHFQGYEVVLIFGLFVPIMGGLMYFPVLFSIIVVFAAPLINFATPWWQTRMGNVVRRLLCGTAILGVVVLGFSIPGIFWGFWIWTGGIVLSLLGVIYESKSSIPAD